MHHYTLRKCNWFILCSITFYTISTHSAFTIKKPMQNIMTRLSCSRERSLVSDQRSVGCFGILASALRWWYSIHEDDWIVLLNRTQLEDEMVATLLSKMIASALVHTPQTCSVIGRPPVEHLLPRYCQSLWLKGWNISLNSFCKHN